MDDEKEAGQLKGLSTAQIAAVVIGALAIVLAGLSVATGNYVGGATGAITVTAVALVYASERRHR